MSNKAKARGKQEPVREMRSGCFLERAAGYLDEGPSIETINLDVVIVKFRILVHRGIQLP